MPSRRAITSSVRSCAGHAEHDGRAEARVHQRRDEHRQRRAVRRPSSTRPVSITGIVSASRELRSQPPERSCSSCSRTSAPTPTRRRRGGAADISTKRASASASAWGVKTVSCCAVGRSAGRARRRRCVRARSAGRRARPRPRCRSAASSARRRSFSCSVGADPQVPLRQLDQPHRPVAAPAGAAGLDLDRGERRLAVLAPVDVAGAAVDQPRLEQLQEQPLRPAVHDRVGAHERALPVEGEAEPLQLAGHVLGAAVDPLARRLAAGDRAELGGQAERVEAEREQHGVAARAPEARVGVADRVAAHVADVDVAGGERRGGLDVDVGLLVEQRRRAERVALAPGRLAARLDRVRAHSACVWRRRSCDRAYPRALPPAWRLLCSAALAHATAHKPPARAPARRLRSPPCAGLRGASTPTYVRDECEDAAMEIEIGRGKKGRRAYGFDDIAIVPSRRTRDPDDIDISWKLGPYQFELPMLASAMDGVVSPETRRHHRPPRRPRGAEPRGHLHALRGRRGAARADRLAAQGGRHARDAGDLPRAGQARADRAADRARSRSRRSSSPPR